MEGCAPAARAIGFVHSQTGGIARWFRFRRATGVHAAPSSRAAASARRRSPLGEDVDMSYPLLISRMASATTGAFLSAARTICGKAAGRMDGEFTLISIAVTARQWILLDPPAAGSGSRRRFLLHASTKDPAMEGAQRRPPSKSLQRRIRDA